MDAIACVHTPSPQLRGMLGVMAPSTPAMTARCAALLGRIVPLLLVARVIAAPVALRPTVEPSGCPLVIRVCAWPVQPSGASPRVELEGREANLGAVSLSAGSPVHAIPPCIRPNRPLGLDAYEKRALGRPRC